MYSVKICWYLSPFQFPYIYNWRYEINNLQSGFIDLWTYCSLTIWNNANYAILYYFVLYMYHHQQNNVTPKGVYVPISKLHSILAVANLLARNNMSQICYCGTNNYRVLKLTAVYLTPLGVTFVLLVRVH